MSEGRKIPFAEEKASKESMSEVKRLLIQEFDRRRAKYISNQNVHIFYHGRSWVSQQKNRDGYSAYEGEMELQEYQVSIEIDRLLANDVSVLPEFIKKFGDQAEEGFLKMFMQTINTSTEASGNVISIRAGESLAEAFLEAIRTVHASIGPNGEVSLPSPILNLETLERLQREIAEKGPEFQSRVEEAKRQQEADARRREAERLAKYGEDE